MADRFSRRFREGISFPNFGERSILKLPLSKLCAVPFALQNRALFKGEKGGQRCLEKGGKGVPSKEGKKEKRTRENGRSNGDLKKVILERERECGVLALLLRQTECSVVCAELSTTTAREQNRALGRQVYGRYPKPAKHRKIISTIAFAGSAKIWAPRWW